MLINLNNRSDKTLQEQIVSEIRAMILNGSLISNEPLTSIRKFASLNKISIITVQRAYEILENEGLIYSRKGKGFFVNEIKNNKLTNIAESNLENDLLPLIEKAKKEGLEKSQVLKIFNKIINKLFGVIL